MYSHTGIIREAFDGPEYDDVTDETPDDCPHDSSREVGDGFEECIDCGQTFFRIHLIEGQ